MYIGIILLACSIGVGFYIKTYNENQIKFKLDILNFCDYLKTQIEFSKRHLKDILQEYSLHATPKLKKIICIYIESLDNENKKCEIGNLLNFEESKFLQQLFDGLGKSDVKSQIELCENVKTLFYSNYDQFKDKKQKMGNLSFKLSFCIGFLLLILIL